MSVYELSPEARDDLQEIWSGSPRIILGLLTSSRPTFMLRVNNSRRTRISVINART